MVHDASSLIAVVFREPGGDVARSHLRGSLTSSVNWSEVAQKVLARGGDTENVREILTGLGVRIVPFSVTNAETAARLHARTSEAGLSLGDRACLALSIDTESEVMTADRVWADLDLDIKVRLIR